MNQDPLDQKANLYVICHFVRNFIEWYFQGPQGFPGVRGSVGLQGPQGAPGTNGENGITGPIGPMVR